MKATITGINEYDSVTLFPETEQELLFLNRMTEHRFENLKGCFSTNKKVNVVVFVGDLKP
jgi:hypothetical protein